MPEKTSVTGYQLRESIRQWVTRRDLANRQFRDSILQFEDDVDTNMNPRTIVVNYETADIAVATLEAAQQLYNGLVTITVQGKPMTLAHAVKRVGGAGRLEAMWREAAGGRKKDRYYDRLETRRNKDEIFAKRQVPMEEATQNAENAARFAAALRNAIAAGNGTAIEIDIDPALLD